MSSTDLSPPVTSRIRPGTALLAPVSPQAWLATAHLILGLPLGILSGVLILTLLALTAGFAITFVVGAACAVVLLACTHLLTAVQRSRFAGVLRVHIRPVRRRYQGTRWQRLFARLRDTTVWRQVGYHLMALPLGVLGFSVAVVGWSTAIGCLLLPLYGPLPERGILGLPMRDGRTVAGIMVFGLLLLYVTAWLVRALAAADAQAARSLLGPSRTEALTERVESLSRSRAGVVDAADAERRRIERDLHDGAQQRLVSLAMNLGMARAQAGDLPEPARAAIESAHDEAKQALAELRDFVRGLHPAVLNDRGLDAALSGIAARSPVPTRLRVRVEPRCSPTIEAVAYFVVAEALTNVAKHAAANHAEVTVERIGDGLRIVVADDGRGGASARSGGGLRGLAHRVAAVDGTLRLDSPAGGPTVLVVELPCES